MAKNNRRFNTTEKRSGLKFLITTMKNNVIKISLIAPKNNQITRSIGGVMLVGLNVNLKPFPAAYDLAKIIASSCLFECVIALFYSLDKKLDWLKMQLYSLFDLVKVYRKYHIKILLIHQQSLPLLCLFARLLGLKLITYIGGKPFYDLGCKQKTINKWLGRVSNINWHFCFLFSNFIVIPIKELMNYFKLQMYSHKLVSAPTRVIDPRTFKVIHKINKRPNRIAYIGRFSYEKGTDIAIVTFLKLAKMFPRLEFIMIGDGPLMAFVKRLVKKNYCKNIKITGWLSTADIVNYLNTLRLVLLPSRNEGLPSLILESMACGTPVLASKVGGISYIIKNNFNGFLLDTLDTNLIAAKIISILKNKRLLTFVSNNARAFIINNYDKVKVQQSWLPILKQLVH
jgi:glycosyltransferase involved in cell wall biosynthesis